MVCGWSMCAWYVVAGPDGSLGLVLGMSLGSMQWHREMAGYSRISTGRQTKMHSQSNSVQLEIPASSDRPELARVG